MAVKNKQAPSHTIYAFITKDLHLKGAKAQVYAVIFAYWLSGQTVYASNDSLADRLGFVRETINRVLKKLVKKELVMVLPEHTRYGSHYYTINEMALNTQAPGWKEELPKMIRARCDQKSQVNVIKSYTSCDQKSQVDVINSHTSCDQKSHHNNRDNKQDKKDKGGILLPHPLEDDKECCRLLEVILRSPKWKNRTPDMLSESLRVLDGRSVHLAREMMRYTIKGGYPQIYEPNGEVQARARQASCDEKSHLPASSEPPKIDDDIIGMVLNLIPTDLRQYAFGRGMGPRPLQFICNHGHVEMHCPSALRDWYNGQKPALEAIIASWVGDTYIGLTPVFI